MKNRGFVALLFLLLSVSEAKIFDRCELAKLMKKAGMDRKGVSINDWICTVYYGSKFNTRAITGINPDGGRNYGIFQINSRWWCTSTKGGKEMGCHMHCKALMNDDIRDDMACAMTIVREPSRMEAWVPWKKHCKGSKNMARWTSYCKL